MYACYVLCISIYIFWWYVWTPACMHACRHVCEGGSKFLCRDLPYTCWTLGVLMPPLWDFCKLFTVVWKTITFAIFCLTKVEPVCANLIFQQLTEFHQFIWTVARQSQRVESMANPVPLPPRRPSRMATANRKNHRSDARVDVKQRYRLNESTETTEASVNSMSSNSITFLKRLLFWEGFPNDLLYIYYIRWGKKTSQESPVASSTRSEQVGHNSIYVKRRVKDHGKSKHHLAQIG